MTTDMFEFYIREGERLREMGNFKVALATLEAARNAAREQADRAIAWAHIGLTYWLMGNRTVAECAFELSLQNARSSQNRGRIIEVQRHIAQLRLNQGNVHEALSLGLDAMNYAYALGRKDLVWFTHIVTVSNVRLHKAGTLPRSVPYQWLLREIYDYMTLGVQDVNEDAKRAWRQGIMRSYLEMFGRILAPIALLRNYLSVRRQIPLKIYPVEIK